MARVDAQFSLRLPDGMRERIAEEAKANLRSMNSEIVLILAKALGFEGATAAGSGPAKANPAAVSTEPGTSPARSTHGL